MATSPKVYKTEMKQILKDKGFVYSRNRIITNPDDSIYGTKTTRVLEYYPEIYFYKLKANWGQSLFTLEL